MAPVLTRAAAPQQTRATVPRGPGRWSLPEVRWAAASAALFAAALAARLAHGPAWLAWTLFLACYAAGGWEPGLAGLRVLRERRLDVDLLMVAAAVGAAAIGQVLDGGLGLAPDRAVRLTADAGEETVDAASLDAGDVILVRRGCGAVPRPRTPRHGTAPPTRSPAARTGSSPRGRG
jgi:cation transport ATPase